ncbi:hypothetical protein HG536_0D01800 [Torulaspora globosa]|uniref:Protein EFR3 n=1 Tax=Torulaspora globosa TaxID=48254 RepID=A0A7G3ZGM2_9SACH|nr:uncharacterized protein HG536_0D01800 [Torulaspora globosa]QLL32658.1 hypothetical protein HG536_0D01800 [Torulaspora globosa]
MRFFTPKHQKLVNQCYPSGRTTDKKPKSSETSYLLYYVNSRRSKLEKVSIYLVKRTAVDLNRRRVGNVAVTLELMAKIVSNCKENLNVFVKDFLHIMRKILSNNNFNNDVSIVELVEEAFSAICKNVDGALCNGDADFVQMYQEFAELYFRVVREMLQNDDLLLKGCIDISYTSSLASSPQINHFIPQSVDLVLHKFVERHPVFKIAYLETANDQTMSKRLSRTQTRTAGLDDVLDSGADLSIKALQSYFTTTETDKLTLSIRALLQFIQQNPNRNLLEFICNGIPVQLRYIVVLLLVRQLNDSSSQPIIVMKLVSSLLVSNVSIVGLSVLDMMRRILKFQLENVGNAEIVDQCCATLTDLNNKIYYRGQTSDMLYEFLLKLRSTKKEEERVVMNNDIKALIRHIEKPCISLELFLDVAPYTGSAEQVRLFDTVEEQVSGGLHLSKLYQLVRQMDSEQEQKVLMQKIFKKYKSFALLSGLNYFTENVSSPEATYYFYHIEASNFLNLEDYRSQAEFKRETNDLFTKDDLINFYSDAGSNKFSKKGAQILMSQNNQISTSDLLCENNLRSNPVNITRDSSIDALAAANTMNNQKANGHKDYRSVNLEDNRSVSKVRSWKSLRHAAPKVEDLKKVMIGNKSSKNRDMSLRGSQSVKSRVTNITFLLSELKSIDDETSHIHDPDEDEIVGLDKTDLARSHSLKALSSNGVSDSKRQSLHKNDQDEDEFQDAANDVTLTGTRGKLF